MDIKTYLGQAYHLDQRINSKLEQITSLRELATKATSTLSDMPSGKGRSLHTMENIIAKMVDLESEINADIDMLVDLKREMVGFIKSVSNTEYQTILELRYLCFKTWEQISVDMGYSIQHVFKMHNKALFSLEVLKDENQQF